MLPVFYKDLTQKLIFTCVKTSLCYVTQTRTLAGWWTYKAPCLFCILLVATFLSMKTIQAEKKKFDIVSHTWCAEPQHSSFTSSLYRTSMPYSTVQYFMSKVKECMLFIWQGFKVQCTTSVWHSAAYGGEWALGRWLRSSWGKDLISVIRRLFSKDLRSESQGWFPKSRGVQLMTFIHAHTGLII